jgi:RNA polymerase sigma-70 factor (ECF subfamily)
MEMLAPDVVWTADSDGKVSAARRPVSGADRVARLLVGLIRAAGEAGRVEPATFNNAPALKLYLGERFEGVITVEIVDGRITHFYAMRNPDKLAGVDIRREISR